MIHSYKKGLSLIEMLVSIGGSLLIIFATLNLFFVATEALAIGGTRSELIQNSRIALERISRDIRQAEEIVTIIPETNSDPENSPSSELEFQDGHDIDSLTYIRYYLDGFDLYMELSFYSLDSAPLIHVTYNSQDAFGNPASKTIIDTSLIAEHVSSLEFFGDELISIQVSVENDGMKIIIPTTVFGRNIIGS